MQSHHLMVIKRKFGQLETTVLKKRSIEEQLEEGF